MPVKLCEGFWITADKHQFIVTRLREKPDEIYKSELKKAKKLGKAPTTVKRYTYHETYHSTIERVLEIALEYSIRDVGFMQEEKKTDDENKRRKPKHVKNIKYLVEFIKDTKKDIKESFASTLKIMTKENLIMLESNAKMTETIKKLRKSLKNKGIVVDEE